MGKAKSNKLTDLEPPSQEQMNDAARTAMLLAFKYKSGGLFTPDSHEAITNSPRVGEEISPWAQQARRGEVSLPDIDADVVRGLKKVVNALEDLDGLLTKRAEANWKLRPEFVREVEQAYRAYNSDRTKRKGDRAQLIRGIEEAHARWLGCPLDEDGRGQLVLDDATIDDLRRREPSENIGHQAVGRFVGLSAKAIRRRIRIVAAPLGREKKEERVVPHVLWPSKYEGLTPFVRQLLSRFAQEILCKA
ncbi:MAG: hypothetical protein AAFU77_01855 [Myxococcota bacterium]